MPKRNPSSNKGAQDRRKGLPRKFPRGPALDRAPTLFSLSVQRNSSSGLIRLQHRFGGELMRFAQIRQNVPCFQVHNLNRRIPRTLSNHCPDQSVWQSNAPDHHHKIQDISSSSLARQQVGCVECCTISHGVPRPQGPRHHRVAWATDLHPPNKWNEKLTVYASNASLQARCDGIDERTLRRRLAHLCEVGGLIVRHQSPNRKRYVVRGMQGEPVLKDVGFDLSPLRDNLNRIRAIGEEQRATDLQTKVLKALLRDRLYKLAEAGFRPETDDLRVEALQKMLRRKTDVATLEAAIKALNSCIPALPEVIEIHKQSTDLTDSLGQNDRHIQSSNKEYIEETSVAKTNQKIGKARETTDVTLEECIEAARSAMEFAQAPPKTWTDVAKLTNQLAPAIGVQTGQLLRTREALGERGTCLAILGIAKPSHASRNRADT